MTGANEQHGTRVVLEANRLEALDPTTGVDSRQAVGRTFVDRSVDTASSVATALIDAPPTEIVEQPSAELTRFFELVSQEFARRHLILSVGPDADGVERLRVASRTPPGPIVNVGVLLERPVRTHIEPDEQLASAIDAAYAAHRARVAEQRRSTRSRDSVQASSDRGTESESAGLPPPPPPGLEIPEAFVDAPVDAEADLERALRDAESDVLNTHGKAPAVRLVDLILFEAAMRGASDVHIQPTRDRLLVRYRLDGALHTVRELPVGGGGHALSAAVTSRVKVMGRLDVAEQRAPQDGRATVTIGAHRGGGTTSGRVRRIDLRISTIPSTYGERVVLRLLDASRSAHLLDFARLGMPANVETPYLAQVARTSGVVLSTGPTGSGKTTTLYTTLAWITKSNTRGSGRAAAVGASSVAGVDRGCELNMMTVEDPVEYDLAGSGLPVSQTQVDPKKNVTFAAGLRHILRQDPDVIMVGEVRDQETARIAVQAALTGHLVLSTLHTNDAPSAVARLIDLGVEPFLVASSLSAVLAQRLVRTVHQPCAGQGCAECLCTGFKGRTGVFELLVLEDSIRRLVTSRASADVIKARAVELGMVPLRQAGAKLVREGATTAAEVARVIEALDEEDLAP